MNEWMKITVAINDDAPLLLVILLTCDATQTIKAINGCETILIAIFLLPYSDYSSISHHGFFFVHSQLFASLLHIGQVYTIIIFRSLVKLAHVWEVVHTNTDITDTNTSAYNWLFRWDMMTIVQWNYSCRLMVNTHGLHLTTHTYIIYIYIYCIFCVNVFTFQEWTWTHRFEMTDWGTIQFNSIVKGYIMIYILI